MKKFFREFKRINWGKTFFGSFRRTVISLVLFIPLLVFLAALGYQEYLTLYPPAMYAHKLQTLTQAVSKTLILPKDETPVTATVTDTSVLPKEKFFSQAQDGDKILMYKKHKLAVLYRPSTDKVITVATLIYANPTPTPTPGGVAKAVAGASTSAALVSSPAVSPAPIVPTTQQSSGTNTFHPQGKILIQQQ